MCALAACGQRSLCVRVHGFMIMRVSVTGSWVLSSGNATQSNHQFFHFLVQRVTRPNPNIIHPRSPFQANPCTV